MESISARILVVDDQEHNRKLVQRVLKPLGYTVLEAEDGEAALTRIEKENPDLVILDVQMPGLDGCSVAQRLKSDPKTRLIPIIMVTSLDQLGDRLQGIDAGVDDYLTKPFQPLELTARVRSLLSLKRFTDELEHASRVLESIALVVEGRDLYTGNHCKRLGEYGARVGLQMGLGKEDIKILQWGGVFHDLGKIAISDGILNKSGKLSSDEWGAMTTHPRIGADLCGGLRVLEKVIPLIRHHHEKLDGSGYPDGLSGEEIPLLVRIVSVVDVYDALATKRSYKESFPPEKCLQILREEADRGWWDRTVVESLARVVGRS